MKITIKFLFLSISIIVFIFCPVNPVSIVLSPGYGCANAETVDCLSKYHTAISCIKSKQREQGSIISEHLNEKSSGHTTVKMLEIPEKQLNDTIGHGGILDTR